MTTVLRALPLVMIAIILSCAPAFAQGAMTNGQNHSGAISVAGEQDSWTFTATVGDRIVVKIGEVAPLGPFFPRIRLNNPNGVQVNFDDGEAAAETGVTATLTGTYTVIVDDHSGSGTQTGSYLITLAKIPGTFIVPGGDEGGPMTNGANHQGSLHLGDLDQWSFSATVGDRIVVKIGEVAPLGPFFPWIGLVAPNGTLVSWDNGDSAAELGAVATLTGTYTVLVDDDSGGGSLGGASTGSYLITLAKIPGSFVVPDGDEGGPMTNGANHQGSLHLGDLDQWSFSATVGDWIVVKIGEAAPLGSFHPWIGLVAPNGNLVSWDNGSSAAEVSATATQSGTYTVLVDDDSGGGSLGGASTGSYLITLAKIPGSFTVPAGDEGGPMTNGANHQGSLHLGDLDQWSFSATVGDRIVVKIGEVAPLGSFYPWIGLVSPNGSLVSWDNGDSAAEVGATATLTGTYTVLVDDDSGGGDSGGASTGSYLITLAKFPGSFLVPAGDEGGPMTNGVSHAGALHLGDLDQWTFKAIVGHAISVSISEVAPVGPFYPWIGLYAPNGTLLTWSEGSSTAMITLSAPQTGRYTVLVDDDSGGGSSGGASTGSYLLTVTGAEPNPPPFTDDPLVVGVTSTRPIHINELRARIDAARAHDNLGAFSYTESIVAGMFIKASHITEMRTALAQAYANVPMTAPTYTDPVLATGMLIKAVHIAELRLAVIAIE